MTDNLQWKVGDVTITRVVESVAHIPAGGLLPSADEAVVASHASWLRPHFVDDDGNLVLSIHALAITAGDRKIIVDTCIGNDRQIPGWRCSTGRRRSSPTLPPPASRARTSTP